MKVAIIGCGITGMSAGITLQKAGIDTVIFEKTNNPGGVITVYKKNILINNALEFVYGTAQNTFANDMWQSLGLFKKSPEIKSCFKLFLWDDHSVGIYKDFDKTVDELVSLGPQDEKRILRLAESLERIGKIELPLITKASSGKAARLFRLFLNCLAVIPDVLRYGMISCERYGKKFSSDALRKFFSDALTGKRSVLEYITLWSFYLSGNFGTPDDNQREMVETLYKSYISSGGEVRFKSSLNGAVVRDGRICELNFDGNTVHDFDFVIFSNDISSVNKIMNNSDIKFPILEKTIKKENITSSCVLYFSLDCENSCGIIENLLIPCAPFKVGSRYTDNFSVRIQRNTDNGTPAVSVTLYQNEKDFAEWKKISDESPEQYLKEKIRVARCVEESIEKRFPDAEGKLYLCDVVTPLTYHRFTGVNCGGWMPESWNPLIYLRFGRGHMPGIKNASVAGQKVFPLGGTTIGAFSGVRLAERIIKHSDKNQSQR